MDKNFQANGLTDVEVADSRSKYGSNILYFKKTNGPLTALGQLFKEPMIILLLFAAGIYFINGRNSDGAFLAMAVVLVSLISIFQNYRSRVALEKLKKFTSPKCSVIRNGKTIEICTEEVVVGDLLIAEEGKTVSADGTIIHSNDFSVEEASLTGESLPAFKTSSSSDNTIYLGTNVASGLAICKVTAVGNQTKLGQIGKSIDNIAAEKTPLQLQIQHFIRVMAVTGIIVFAIVWMLNYIRLRDVMDSLLKSLTLAMSILPEEIPVAFAAFTAIGAWRLMKSGIIIKHMNTVETLGSATVICIDKTGTITKNQMKLAKLFIPSRKTMTDAAVLSGSLEKELIEVAMFASEPIPFDSMEIEIHRRYLEISEGKPHGCKMVHEYPLSGKPPMMTHVFEGPDWKRIITAKGAPEALLAVSNIDQAEKKLVMDALNDLLSQGYRVLGVGRSDYSGTEYPAMQQQLQFSFKGLLAFYDPPKENIGKVLSDFYRAGIKVKIITGDHGDTTIAIAKQVGFKSYGKTMTGEQLMALGPAAFKEAVAATSIFSRMFPEAKLRVIEQLKASGEIVAMTGDGINDGPALKAAHIGIAMGRKGTEIAKQASSLILVDDDLAKMVEAVAMGRRIYANLKKAIQYIISIHIPIILIVFIPLILGWVYPNLFSPVHVIFLELIMGPTCSIIYENEPLEKNAMAQNPRPFTSTFFSLRELSTSFLQGIAITIGALFIYQFALLSGCGENLTRTMVFISIVAANIFLTLVNRSFYYSVLATLRYQNKLMPIIIGVTVLLLALLVYNPRVRTLFEFESPSSSQVLLSVGVGFISVVWFEAVKWRSRVKSNKRSRRLQSY